MSGDTLAPQCAHLSTTSATTIHRLLLCQVHSSASSLYSVHACTGRYKGYKLLGLSDPVQPKRKNKTKKERDAAASGNTQPISTYFPSASGSRRVRLDRKLKWPVRTLPLSESSSSATFYPRVHRPEILITAPPRIRAPDSASAFSGGWRESRPRPLDVTDLWVGGTVAGPSQTSVLEDHHKCSICLQLKSHPVTSVMFR